MNRIVIKRDGSREKFRTQQIINAIFDITKGLDFEDDYEIIRQYNFYRQQYCRCEYSLRLRTRIN